MEELALKRLYLTESSDYTNKQIKDLGLSSKKIHIISVKRGDRYIIPDGSLTLLAGDQVLFSQS